MRFVSNLIISKTSNSSPCHVTRSCPSEYTGAARGHRDEPSTRVKLLSTRAEEQSPLGELPAHTADSDLSHWRLTASHPSQPPIQVATLSLLSLLSAHGRQREPSRTFLTQRCVVRSSLIRRRISTPIRFHFSPQHLPSRRPGRAGPRHAIPSRHQVSIGCCGARSWRQCECMSSCLSVSLSLSSLHPSLSLSLYSASLCQHPRSIRPHISAQTNSPHLLCLSVLQTQTSMLLTGQALSWAIWGSDIFISRTLTNINEI